MTPYLLVPLALLFLLKRRMQTLDIKTLKFDNLPVAKKDASYSMYINSGYRTKERPNHNGVDIASPTGTPIYAPLDGVVSSVWNDTTYGGGNSIILLHGVDQNIRTGYAHLSKFNVTKGKSVKAGDVIGFVGSTGRSTGPHLHFTLRYKQGGVFQEADPTTFLKALL